MNRNAVHRARATCAGLAILLLLAAAARTGTGQTGRDGNGDAALSLADLAAYRAALSERKDGQEPPAPVSFRALWDHPATYQGRRVQVQGRLVRRFRQGSFGTFPPLEEAWIFSPAGDPFCLVFPATTEAKTNAPKKTGSVRFAGTFLKLVEYQAGDGARLAPLIVGPAPPVAVAAGVASRAESNRRVPTASGGNAKWSRTRLDWLIAGAAAVVVGLVLAYQHIRRPMRRPLDLKDTIAPDPLFDDAPAPAPEPRRPEP